MILLRLLEIGIPYDTVMELSEDEISNLLGVHQAILEKQQEDQETRQ